MSQNDYKLFVIFLVAAIFMAGSAYYQKRKAGVVDNKKVTAWFYRVLLAAVGLFLILAIVDLIWNLTL